MVDRRSFLAAVAAVAPAPAFAATAFRRLADAQQVAGTRSPADLAGDEDFWEPIQRAFDLDRSMLNFNSGGCSPAPTHVLQQMIRDLQYSNELPVLHMWGHLEGRVEAVRRDLAEDFGCDPEELAIVRNASEANETMIFGLDLQRGDEVIVSDLNYGRMTASWEQRARRDGVVIKTVTYDVPSSDEHVLARFLEAVTPRTRAIEITHINNFNGLILPVRRLVDAVRPKGVQVFVDGAHAYAHFPFTRDTLDCDYYGTSLHKWLCAPIGTGFLYVRRDKIKALWPLLGSNAGMMDNIRKYEEFGTHPAANHNAIGVALAFHRSIGVERKLARLRWLRDRWSAQLQTLDPRVKILTPMAEGRSGAIGLFAVDGIDVGKFATVMLDKHRVVCTPIGHPKFSGIRVTPNIFSTRDDCDRFADLAARVLKDDFKLIASG